MKTLRALAACAIVLTCSQTFGGTEQPRTEATTQELNPQRFELAVESGYLFGAINPPQDYQIGAEFLTARLRWGVVQRDIWLRGYNQFYISAIAEPIFRGIENHYFGLNLGMRYNFVRPGSPSFPTFQVGSVWDGSTVTRKFPAARARILRSIFYPRPEFPILWTITGR